MFDVPGFAMGCVSRAMLQSLDRSVTNLCKRLFMSSVQSALAHPLSRGRAATPPDPIRKGPP